VRPGCTSTIAASEVDQATFARQVENATFSDYDLVVITTDGAKHKFGKGTLVFKGKDFSSQTLSNGRTTLRRSTTSG
jgi:hypothetical protein